MIRQFMLGLLAMLTIGCTPTPHSSAPTPYDDPFSAEWENLDTGAKREMAAVLRRYPEVRRAYLIKRLDPDDTFAFILDIEFDGEANSHALDAASAAFNRVAKGHKRLEIMLPTPEAQADIVRRAKAKPFYERH